MQWDEAIREYTKNLKEENINSEWAERIYQLIDLTSLNETDTESSISLFCEKAKTSLGHVAAICTYPRFTKLVAAEFADTPVQVATVANFPHGTNSLETTLIEIGKALQDGAQEIDVVFPYQRYLEGDTSYARSFIVSCKAACGDSVKLKVILETAALHDSTLIADASKEAIAAGADFIKTSTGKIAKGGATLEASATILLVIRDFPAPLNKKVGFKVSGGIKTMQQALQYIRLAEHIMGPAWVKPATFRIGSSHLVDSYLSFK